jgi:thymidylate synthase
MRQYLDLGQRIIDDGVWIENARTGKRCRTIINADLEYDMSEHLLPILTTKEVNWKAAIAEFLGYLKGYSSAAQFRELGCKTWDANANENEAWLRNPYRNGEDDMGRVYGVQMRSWSNNEGRHFDQLEQVYDKLKVGIDDRALIITMFNPGELHMGCLNACVHTHHFSLTNGVLDLTSYQRSNDFALGMAFNQVQLGMFLMLMAQITGNKAGTVHHKNVNVHLYEDQYDTFCNVQMPREPRCLPKLYINPKIQCLNDIGWITTDDFELSGYSHEDAIKYPFSV